MFVMTYQMEERKREKNANRLKAVLAVILTAAGAVIASLSTKTDTLWYQSLTLSPLQPPPLVLPSYGRLFMSCWRFPLLFL